MWLLIALYQNKNREKLKHLYERTILTRAIDKIIVSKRSTSDNNSVVTFAAVMRVVCLECLLT